MSTVRKPGVSLFVDRSSGCWIVRDPDGNFRMAPPVEDPWEHRQPFQATDDDFAEGGLRGEELMAGIVAPINDTRGSLARMAAARDGARQDPVPDEVGHACEGLPRPRCIFLDRGRALVFAVQRGSEA